jgi:hypothetical protein
VTKKRYEWYFKIALADFDGGQEKKSAKKRPRAAGVDARGGRAAREKGPGKERADVMETRRALAENDDGEVGERPGMRPRKRRHTDDEPAPEQRQPKRTRHGPAGRGSPAAVSESDEDTYEQYKDVRRAQEHQALMSEQARRTSGTRSQSQGRTLLAARSSGSTQEHGAGRVSARQTQAGSQTQTQRSSFEELGSIQVCMAPWWNAGNGSWLRGRRRPRVPGGGC